jgi:hypothetical protein
LVARLPERTLFPVWTVFRFSLSGGGARAYRDALEILRGAGFRQAPGPLDPSAAFPASVLAEVRRDPADVTRAIFSALADAGLRPVAVSGCRARERPRDAEQVARVARA